MSKLKHHKTNMVPAMPIKASVHPKVQVSMISQEESNVKVSVRAGLILFDFREKLVGLNSLSRGDF
jgi:hypothetical protein